MPRTVNGTGQNRPDGRKKKPIEPTAEMDGSGAKIQVQLPAE